MPENGRTQQQSLIHTFLQEADDLLTQIEETVLDLRGRDADSETVNELFRAFHTIKGSAAMFGFDAVSTFTHEIENVLDSVRNGRIALSHELLEIVLAARDQIKRLLDGGDSAEGPEACQQILARLAGVFEGSSPEQSVVMEDEKTPQRQRWHIRFRPDPGLLATGGNPVLILRELRALGECIVQCHIDRLPHLEQIQSDKLYLHWEITLDCDAGIDAIRDVFLFVEDGSEIVVEPLEMEPIAPVQEVETTASAPAAKQSKSTAKTATVRVPSTKLDLLVNLVGELVMNQSRLTQVASRFSDPELATPVEEIERLIAQLRDNVLGIRMMPIGTTFNRFKRLVHDLAAELGKDINLVTEGAETELDKTVLDALGDPMVHLIRNSIDHGIEPTEERVRAGKPRQGSISLTAIHTGSNVVVRIQDDGRGLNRAAIRDKAVEKQLISPDANLSDKEIFNLIFLPGFSTAKQVTSVSGRGVGMDAVRRQIEALRGSISIDSKPGAGTTIALTLPLTLAIIDGLLVEVGPDQFILPMSLVMENVELHRAERSRNNGRNVIAVRGELIPYVSLRETFDVEGYAPDIEKIVIVRHDEQRVGLVVDRVVGSHQTVIQSLGSFYRNVDAFSGATIMGDGRVALIVELAGLIGTDSKRVHGWKTEDYQQSRKIAQESRMASLV